MAKLNDRCFCYFTAAMLMPLPTWRLHTKLYKFEWNTFLDNARMNESTDLNQGEVVYISIIFHIPASWLNILHGYDFYFWWCDTANQPLNIRFILFPGRRIKREGQGRCPAFPWLQPKWKGVGRTCLRQLWASAGLWAAQESQRECHRKNCYHEIWENISRK